MENVKTYARSSNFAIYGVKGAAAHTEQRNEPVWKIRHCSEMLENAWPIGELTGYCADELTSPCAERAKLALKRWRC